MRSTGNEGHAGPRVRRKAHVLAAMVAWGGLCVWTFSTAGQTGSNERSHGKTLHTDSRGTMLYQQHCVGCHGSGGDGQGVAAVYLHPKPRNFRLGRYKLVSTSNNVPTREDLLAVLQRGMPGSSMPSWQHLPPADLEALIDELIRLRSDGARQQYADLLRDEEDLSEEELLDEDVQAEIDDYVESVITPGETSEIPPIHEATTAAVERGRSAYMTFGCVSCHGESGKGDGVQAMLDDDHFPTEARDFTLGIFKGGDDPASLYRRVAYGMPGTPMPSSSAMTQEQMVDLVHYIRSLSSEEQRQSVIMRRVSLVAGRRTVVPGFEDPQSWTDVPSQRLTMVPLWWRNDADPGLQVQVVHDGKSIGVRLTWRDATRNERAVQPEEFADMVAVQLVPAGHEPFLGMGSEETPVDLWHWRASSVDLAASDQQLDDYPFDSEEYLRLLSRESHLDFVTARAIGNPLTTRRTSATNLVAEGPGSTTFRPTPSQLVQAEANWQDGVWTVQFQRRLQLSADGLTLIPGDAYAVAFAVWDGAHRDRASQKVITFWHDLRLE